MSGWRSSNLNYGAHSWRRPAIFLVILCLYPVDASSQNSPPKDDSEFEALEVKPEEKMRFFRTLELEASSTTWYFHPFGLKESDENSDWSRVTTEEKYRIEPLQFYGGRATLKTRYLDINLTYQSNRGFEVNAGDSSYLALLLMLTGIPILDRVSFYYETLDFKHGRVSLVERGTSLPLDVDSFQVLMNMYEVRLQQPKLRFFLRYMHYSLPRNVYLKQTIGEGETAQHTYFPISDNLMKIETKFGLAGLSIDDKNRRLTDGYLVEDPDRRNLIFELLAALGGGPYWIRTIRSERELDSGYLLSLLAQVSLGYQWHAWDTLIIGIQNDLALLILSPIGLPEKLDKAIEEEGLDSDGLSLDFGTAEILNCTTAFIRLEF